MALNFEQQTGTPWGKLDSTNLLPRDILASIGSRPNQTPQSKTESIDKALYNPKDSSAIQAEVASARSDVLDTLGSETSLDWAREMSKNSPEYGSAINSGMTQTAPQQNETNPNTPYMDVWNTWNKARGKNAFKDYYDFQVNGSAKDMWDYTTGAAKAYFPGNTDKKAFMDVYKQNEKYTLTDALQDPAVYDRVIGGYGDVTKAIAQAITDRGYGYEWLFEDMGMPNYDINDNASNALSEMLLANYLNRANAQGRDSIYSLDEINNLIGSDVYEYVPYLPNDGVSRQFAPSESPEDITLYNQGYNKDWGVGYPAMDALVAANRAYPNTGYKYRSQ